LENARYAVGKAVGCSCHSGVYGVANDAPAAAGSVCTERLYAESMHSSSSAAGMAGEAKLLSLIRRSHGVPKPSSSLCRNKTNKMDNHFCAPQDSHHAGFPKAFRLSTRMLLFCHSSLGKQLQVDPCDLPMHSCIENRYVNSLID